MTSQMWHKAMDKHDKQQAKYAGQVRLRLAGEVLRLAGIAEDSGLTGLAESLRVALRQPDEKEQDDE